MTGTPPATRPPARATSSTNLRRHGATAQEILAAGLGRTSTTGRLIDQFRDRLIFPIHGPDGHIHGFIARRNPAHDHPDDIGRVGPKYLNTPHTDLFTKGAQLFGLHEGRAALAAGATPTLVEGPLDAIAITLTGQGTHVGSAPLGTALTDQQANQLLPYIGPGRPGVLVATDADKAGWKAAQRAYWHLVARGANPGHALMTDGTDPAQILQHHGPAAIRQLLATSQPLARSLIDDQPPSSAGTDNNTIRRLAAIIAALPPEHWIDHLLYAVTRVHTPPGPLQLAVIDAAHAWTDDPRGQARRHISAIADPAASRAPIPTTGHGQDTAQPRPPAQPGAPTQRRADTVARISPTLLTAPDWPSLSHAIHRARTAGYDIAEQLPRLAAQQPLSSAPAAASTDTTSYADRVTINERARRRLADRHRRTESSDHAHADHDATPEPERSEDRWRTLIRAVDADILTDDGWTALAATLDHAAATGLNVADELPRLATADGPLPRRHAAAELRYRVLARVKLDPATPQTVAPETPCPLTTQPPQPPPRSHSCRPAPPRP
jgi:DNA primase